MTRFRPKHILGLALCFTAVPSFAQTAINTPIITTVTGVDNFRDVAGIAATYGGTGFANSSTITGANGMVTNGVMRTGVFYRSNALSPLGTNPADLAKISPLGITQVVDLRTPGEVSAKPDVLPTGASYVNISVFGATTPAMTANAVTYMQSLNQLFVTDPNVRANLKSIFQDLAAQTGPALYHCTAGKDRAGWVSATLESIAGVSSSQIMTDFLATNQYTAKSITALTPVYAPLVGGTANAAAILGVQSSFLQAGLDQITASYGTMNNYLLNGLGLSQADIYALRAKMVRYQSLPGQAQLSGNAANGAALLTALQDSSLSGRYTAYNYYLQSAIDAGSLGGMESKVGGQIHADSAASFLRQPQLVDETLSPYVTGRELKQDETNAWFSAIAGEQGASGGAGIASSTNRSSGFTVGANRRIYDTTSAYIGVGQVSNKVASADANATVDNSFVVLGGRYALTSLKSGTFIDAQLMAGNADYKSTRSLGNGLGTSSGSANGTLFSGRVNVGSIVDMAPVKLIPQIGLRAVQAKFDGFTEQGSELALRMKSFDKTTYSALAELGIALDERKLDGGWSITPNATLGYEHVLGTPESVSTGDILGYAVSQTSAYNSRDLARLGVALSARSGALHIQANASATTGKGTKGVNSIGIKLGYTF